MSAKLCVCGAPIDSQECRLRGHLTGPRLTVRARLFQLLHVEWGVCANRSVCDCADMTAVIEHVVGSA